LALRKPSASKHGMQEQDCDIGNAASELPLAGKSSFVLMLA